MVGSNGGGVISGGRRGGLCCTWQGKTGDVRPVQRYGIAGAGEARSAHDMAKREEVRLAQHLV